MTRKLEFHVEVQELNDTGEYVPVEVQPRTNVGTGGIFQLRQGTYNLPLQFYDFFIIILNQSNVYM